HREGPSGEWPTTLTDARRSQSHSSGAIRSSGCVKRAASQCAGDAKEHSNQQSVIAMRIIRQTFAVMFLAFLSTAPALAQQAKSTDDPDVLLKQALRYGDLYNWSDAAPLFSRA